MPVWPESVRNSRGSKGSAALPPCGARMRDVSYDPFRKKAGSNRASASISRVSSIDGS
jgi:hypothetical protein